MDRTYRDEYRSLGLNIALCSQKNHLSAVELGNVGVSLDAIFRFCDKLDVSPSDLFDFR